MALFQRGRVTLAWSEQHELNGLEIVMRRQPFGEIIESWLIDATEANDGEPTAWDAQTPAQRAERSKENAAALGVLIVSWNLADDDTGEPVPWPPLDEVGNPYRWPPTGPDAHEARAAGGETLLRHCDVDMLGDMRVAYNAATARVAPPLPPSSPDGPAASSEPVEPMPEEWDMPAQETVGAAAG